MKKQFIESELKWVGQKILICQCDEEIGDLLHYQKELEIKRYLFKNEWRKEKIINMFENEE